MVFGFNYLYAVLTHHVSVTGVRFLVSVFTFRLLETRKQAAYVRSKMCSNVRPQLLSVCPCHYEQRFRRGGEL